MSSGQTRRPVYPARGAACSIRGVSLTPDELAKVVAALPEARRGETSAIPGAWAAVREAWPQLVDAPAGFFARVLPRVAGEAPLAEVVWADLALADACLRGLPAALTAFEEQHGAALEGALAAAGLPAETRGEALQRLRLRLLVAEEGAPRLASYAGRGSLRAWLKVAAVREALMLVRAAGRRAAHEVAVDDAALLEGAALADDPELLMVRERCREALREAFTAAIDALDSRERTLLRLSLRDRLGVEQLGALFRVHRATAARWLAAVRTKLHAAVRSRLAARLNIGTGEVESIIRAVGSRIDLSLSGLE